MIIFIALLIVLYVISRYLTYSYDQVDRYESPPKIGRIWKNCDSIDGMNDSQQCTIPTDFGQPSWFNIKKNYDMNLGIFKIT
jgi:hypothetical protein